MATLLPILTFHAVDDQLSVLSFSPSVFQRVMANLHEHGYQTLDLREVVDYLQQHKPFPDRSFVLTFDDGYQSVYTEAFPVLQRYGMSATVFLTVGRKKRTKSRYRLPTMEGRSMLSWGEIREMQRGGITFGAHSLTHPDLSRLSTEQASREIVQSKEIIEDALGTPVTCFAYPFGYFDQRSHAIVQQYFTCACSVKLGLITANSDFFALERVDTYYLRTEKLFNLMLTRWFPWYIQARNIPRQLRHAVQRRIG